MTESRWVHIVDEVPELAGQGAPGPVMVVALQGFLDAGNAAAPTRAAPVDRRVRRDRSTIRVLDSLSSSPCRRGPMDADVAAQCETSAATDPRLRGDDG